MRIHVVAVALVAAAFAVWAPTASAVIPIVHIDVTPIEHVAFSGRPLTESDWAERTPAFVQRLNEAGDEQRLALEETLREEGSDALKEALKRCGENAAQADYEAQQQGQDFTLADAVAACLAGQLPESAPDAAKEQVSDWLLGVIGQPTEDAVAQGRPLNATVTLPSLTGQAAPPPAVVVPPTDGGGGFPWLLVGLGVVVVGGIALGARRG